MPADLNADLSAEQDGYIRLLERLVARVRAGEVRMLRYEAVAGTCEVETDHGTYEVEPTGKMTLTLWCQQLVAPRAAAPAAPPPAPPTPEDPRANVRIDTYVQSIPNGMWTITATNLLTGASVTRQGRGPRTAAEREAVDAVAGAPSLTQNRRHP